MFSVVSRSLYSAQVLAFRMKSLHMTVKSSCAGIVPFQHFLFFSSVAVTKHILNVVLLFFQVKDLTKFLDPSGLGVISFEDFHRGISAISNGGE